MVVDALHENRERPPINVCVVMSHSSSLAHPIQTCYMADMTDINPDDVILDAIGNDPNLKSYRDYAADTKREDETVTHTIGDRVAAALRGFRNEIIEEAARQVERVGSEKFGYGEHAERWQRQRSEH